MTTRVLVVPSYYPTPAAPLTGSFFREQAQALAAAMDVRVLVTRGQPTRRFLARVPLPSQSRPLPDPPAHVAVYRTDRFMRWPSTLDSMSKAVVSHVTTMVRGGWRPNVILAHQFFWGGVLASRVGRALGVPVVCVEHACPWLLYKFSHEQQMAIRQAIADVTIVGVVSPALRRLMLMHDLPRDLRWAVVGNLVDESLFHPGDPRTSRHRDEYVVAAVANRAFKKDLKTLFEAVALVKERQPERDLRVLAVGDFRGSGPSLDSLAEAAGVPHLVETKASLDRAAVAELMRSADLFVSTSIAETFGIVMAEALACGIPVIATRSGGAEYILGDDSPFLVEVQDPPELADRIESVMTETLLFDPVAASAEIVSRFGRAAFTQRMVDVLGEAQRVGGSSSTAGNRGAS